MVPGGVPVHHAGRFDPVDDDDLLVAVVSGCQRDSQRGSGRLDDLHQQRPRGVGHCV